METLKTPPAFPLVSIIIPVYNGSNFLRVAIESALNQTYQNIEVLVINDGSNDNNKTEAICKLFGDKIRYFYKENGGVATALNMGINKSNGKYFSWLSHDDFYELNKIKIQLEFMQKTPNTKIVSSNFAILNQETQAIVNRQIKGKKIFKNGRDIIENWLDFCTFLIDKDCFEKVKLFDTNLKTIQDLDMQFRLISKFPIFHINKILSTRRDHSSQGTKTQLKFHLKELDNYLIKLFKWKGINYFMKENESLFSAYFNLGLRTMNMSCEKACKLFYYKALTKRPFSPRLLLLVLFGKRAFNILYK